MPPPPLPARRPLPPLPPRTVAGAHPGLSRPAGEPPVRAGSPRPGRAAVVRSRPDPTALRIALGFGGVAAASALTAAFLVPASAGTPSTLTTSVVTAAVGPIQRDTQYIQLLPGQTAPPNANVAQAPAPTPRIVVVTTRQSGVKK